MDLSAKVERKTVSDSFVNKNKTSIKKDQNNN